MICFFGGKQNPVNDFQISILIKVRARINLEIMTSKEKKARCHDGGDKKDKATSES